VKAPQRLALLERTFAVSFPLDVSAWLERSVCLFLCRICFNIDKQPQSFDVWCLGFLPAFAILYSERVSRRHTFLHTKLVTFAAVIRRSKHIGSSCSPGFLCLHFCFTRKWSRNLGTPISHAAHLNSGSTLFETRPWYKLFWVLTLFFLVPPRTCLNNILVHLGNFLTNHFQDR
jgi:hypothetical protein